MSRRPSLAPLRAGDPAPHFEVVLQDGKTLAPEALRGRPALLVFLRHLH